MTIKQEFIAGLVKMFPKARNHTLAKAALRLQPSMFPNVEACRTHIRNYRRGNNGQHKLSLKLPSNPVKVGDAFQKLPQGKTEYDEWNAVKLNAKRALILADIHLPFHKKDALLTAIAYGKKNNADMIILNGDTADFFSVSFWEKDPRHRDFKNEIETVREFISGLRKTFPNAQIVFKLGNHEERFERYMRVKAPELLDIEDFEMQKILHFDKYGVDLVGQRRPMKLGDLNIIHGHEYRFAIANPVNPARGLFLRCKAYAICGHFHQSSYHTEKTVEQNVIATWSTGCLCDFHPEYMPFNNWMHGFAFVEVANDGKFQMHHRTIRNGKVY